MKIRLHLNIFIFILIFILTRQIEIYGILMLFAILHELGHMIAGILLGFKPRSLEIMPFGLAVSFESKIEDCNKKIIKANMQTVKKIAVAASGVITNLIFILVFSVFDISVFGIERQLILYANILIAIFNLIPIYPLDGGRIIDSLLHIMYGKKEASRYTNMISNITITILTAITSIAILYFKNIAILFILTYLWYLVITENKKYNNKKQIYDRLEEIVKVKNTEIIDSKNEVSII